MSFPVPITDDDGCCDVCGEGWDIAKLPNIEIMEMLDRLVCDECATAILQDNEHFGVRP